MEQIILKDSGSRIKPIEEGTYMSRCVKMIDVGTIEEEFKGEKKTLRKVHLTWELPTELIEGGDYDGNPRVVSKEYTASLNSKATLRKHLEAWRGKKFTEEEAKEFALTKLIGVPCQITIVHNAKGYAEISSISGITKGITAPNQITESKVITVNNCHEERDKVPSYIWDKIITSSEYFEKYSVETKPTVEAEEEDDVPF